MKFWAGWKEECMYLDTNKQMACADPGIFVRGVQASLTKKPWQCFFFFFSPQLILQKSNGQFQRNLSFFKVPEGVQHFPGGVQLLPGGVQLLILYSNPYNLWFSRGGPNPLSTPLDPHLNGKVKTTSIYSHIQVLRMLGYNRSLNIYGKNTINILEK